MARVAWIYRRCNRWDLISEALLPMIRSSAAEFSPGDFARLAQALPEEGAGFWQVWGDPPKQHQTTALTSGRTHERE